MTISSSLLPEFDQLIAGTRKTLERIPADKLDYKPHEKSMPMISLATHVANMLNWGVVTITSDNFDFQPSGSEPYKEEPAKSVEDLLATLDKNAAAFRSALSDASDEQLLANWSLLKGGVAMFTLPRIAVIRDFVFNHVIHHRAQLGVYLRLNDVPVPSIYGPSADEGVF